MNFKHYFPTFRARWRFLESALAEVGRVPRALHIGCGEGDHDRLIKSYADELVACDLNADDVEHARAVNRATGGIEYRVEDATALRLPNQSFDIVVCMEVIEHVSDSRKLLSEIARVLTPNGRVILTCPSERFPFTYDPINFVLAPLRTHLPFGAYGYGHDWLVREEALKLWFAEAGMTELREEHLTGWLASTTECYWLGFAQLIAKANAGNTAGSKRRGVRPSSDREPRGVALVDSLVSVDAALQWGRRSVGLGYLLGRASR